MAESSKIEWTDHTFNPWIGCTKVSVGPKGACESCYAEVATPSRAMRIKWGPGKPRHRTSIATWSLPLKWERDAGEFQSKHGRRQRVFCASLADVFDNEVDPQWRTNLFDMIGATPSLDWLLLTKRIGNAQRMLPSDWAGGYKNVWLGATVVTQEEIDRDVPKLIETPARIRFLSCEPLLEEVTFAGRWIDHENPSLHENWLERIDWVIVGGESGKAPRPMAQQWVECLRFECASLGVPFFMKQGSAANWPAYKDFARFPPFLQVREWPL